MTVSIARSDLRPKPTMRFLTASLLAMGAAGGCSAPASTPSGFSQTCSAGPRISGVAEMGVSNDGLITDIDDMTVSFGGGRGTTCAGAAVGPDDRDAR